MVTNASDALPSTLVMRAREHILDRSPDRLRALIEGWGEPGYRADQVSRAIFAHGATEFAAVPGLPSGLRERLEEQFRMDAPEVLARVTSEDGATTKVLLDLGGGAAVESVRMAYDPEDASSAGRARVTLCVSTQVGCAMGCTFCATGQQGFTRNLATSEILAQVLHFVREADGDPSQRVTNVVFMGMGEPLANYAHTLEAVRWLVDERGLHLRQRGITISTVGLRSGIRRLASEGLQVNLTISLHAPDDELRRRLIPAAAGTSIDELVESARECIAATGRRVTFAYALLDGVNDSEEQARRLASRVRGLQSHVNLIPYNPTAGEGLRRPTRERVRAFLHTLQSLGVNATVRIERGAAIAAACGQLRTDVERAANAN